MSAPVVWCQVGGGGSGEQDVVGDEKEELFAAGSHWQSQWHAREPVEHVRTSGTCEPVAYVRKGAGAEIDRDEFHPGSVVIMILLLLFIFTPIGVRKWALQEGVSVADAGMVTMKSWISSTISVASVVVVVLLLFIINTSVQSLPGSIGTAGEWMRPLDESIKALQLSTATSP